MSNPIFVCIFYYQFFVLGIISITICYSSGLLSYFNCVLLLVIRCFDLNASAILCVSLNLVTLLSLCSMSNAIFLISCSLCHSIILKYLHFELENSRTCLVFLS